MVKAMCGQTGNGQFSGYLLGTSIGKVFNEERLKGSNLTNIHILDSDDLVLCYHQEENQLEETKYYFSSEKLCGGEVDMEISEDSDHLEEAIARMVEGSQAELKEIIFKNMHQFFSDGKNADDKFYTWAKGEIMVSMLCMHSEGGKTVKISVKKSDVML